MKDGAGERDSTQKREKTLPPRRVRWAAAVFGAGLLASQLIDHELDQRRQITSQATQIGELTSRNEQLANDINAFMQRMQRLARLAAAAGGVNPEALLGQSLQQPNELPGFDRLVTPEQREQLAAATVKIVTRAKGSGGAWAENCTGVKVSLDGASYIMTAAHCFQQDIIGVGKGGIPEDFPSAANMASVSSMEYAVIDPDTEVVPGSIEPIAFVHGVSVDITGIDWALLEISGQYGTYEQIPALTINTAEPIPGEQVALHSAPEANQHNSVAAVGTFLGRVSDPFAYNRMIDLVGLHAPSPTADACNYGASGSLAVTAEGSTLGPLAFRNNITYGPNVMQQPSDDPVVSLQSRLQFEQVTGIDLSSFTTLCGFSVPTAETIPSLLQGLSIPYESLATWGQ